MAITVKFFASLSEQLGMSETVLDTDDPVSVSTLWDLSTDGADLPAKTLCAINMEYARFEDTVNNGDEVAFFPPVTGGSTLSPQ